MNEDKSSRYHRLKRQATVAGLALSAALLAALQFTPASGLLRDAAMAAAGAGPSHPLTVAGFVLAILVVQEAVALPLAFYSSFVLERRFGLSAEPFSTWIADHAKAALVGTAVALAGAQIVYATIDWWPSWWWVVSAGAFAAGIALLATLAPVLLLPLFYRFTPLDRESLRTRLESLSARAGVRVLGVYEWGLGEKTRRANAALVGTGRTRRVLLSDTLLAEYSEDEIEVILAHELGHHAHRDILHGLVLEGVLLCGAFSAAALALAGLWRPLGLLSPADVAGLPLLTLAGGIVPVLATPILNAISRRNERRADRYALALTNRPAAFVSAMRRLAAQNLAEERPSRAALILFHTHPPFEERIRSAAAFDPAPARSSA